MSDSATEVDNPSEEPSHLQDIFSQDVHEPEADPIEDGAEEVNEDVSEEDGGDEKPPETNDKMSELQAKLETLEANLAAEKTQNANAQKLINRQGNELGDLRKTTVKEPTAEEFLDEFADDPVKANLKLMQMEQDKRDLAKADNDNAVAQKRSAILNLMPDFASQTDGIKEWYTDKGASADFVSSLTTESLMSNVDLAVALGEIQNLQKQLAETKTKTTTVIDKLNKGGTVLKSKSGQSTDSDSTIQIPSNITNLSDKQLEKLLKESA